MEVQKFSGLLPLSLLNMDINVKHEIMTMNSLEYLRDYGCRILVIN